MTKNYTTIASENRIEPTRAALWAWLHERYKRDRLGNDDSKNALVERCFRELVAHGYAMISPHDSTTGKLEVATMPGMEMEYGLQIAAWRYHCKARGLDPDDLSKDLE